MSKYQPYMEIDSNYGWDNNNFMLYPTEIIYNQNINQNNNQNINQNNLNKNNVNNHHLKICNTNHKQKKDLEIKIKKKEKEKVNDFPMAWTCYKDNHGNWICPLRGDK